ncbi:MAG: DUF3080 family protein [Idiomarina sp.]|nr:DUF3080 family protein [Idiomarina sp.]
MIATLVVSASACSDSNQLDTTWENYQHSLSEATGEPVHTVDSAAMPIMPRSADLRIEIDRLSIGLLDSLRLERCRLGQVVAQRNSALGHAQSPSARLRYELDSMLAIEECLQIDSITDDRINALLSEALEQKQLTLPLYIDQVLTRSEEFRRSMRAANRTHPLTPANDFNEPYAALAYFAGTFEAALEGRWHAVDLAPYNSHMQVLMQNDFLPRHWRTMQRSAAWLDAVNDMLDSAVIRGDCQLPPGAEQNLGSEFADNLQPMLARWTGHQQALTPVLRQLQDMSVQGQWRAYVDELIAEGSHVEQVDDLTQRHVMLLEQTISACRG